MEQVYIIVYDNAQWCGGELYCLVKAVSEDEAEILADTFMCESQLELFADHYNDDPLEEGDICYNIVSVEPLKDSEFAEFEADEGQRSFYPKVNF